MRTTPAVIARAHAYHDSHYATTYCLAEYATLTGLSLTPSDAHRIWHRWSRQQGRDWLDLPDEPDRRRREMQRAIDGYFEPWLTQ